MEKLDEGFFDQYTDDFADYFENQRVMRIMLGSEYKKINKAICEIKNKYPNVVTLLEDGEKTKLNDEEENAKNAEIYYKANTDMIFKCASVDEAHSSQTGNSAKKLKIALADRDEALKKYAELEAIAEENEKDYEDKIVEELATHGKQDNLSFFAFTATPKGKTLELFGTKQQDGTFRPFHIYSMRQAIEEEFILDVLANYMTYESIYKIAKKIPDNPEVSENYATKYIKKFESLHEINITQKTQIIVEQFRKVTKNKIGGK